MEQRTSQTIRLSVMLALTFGFFVVEIVVGYVTDSLALISDSYHMLSDFIAIIVGLACVRISYWTSPKNTFGWVRAEVLGASVNSVFLIALCFTILTDGITRLIEPVEIHNVDLLLYVGIAGLGINVVGLFMFCSDTRGSHHGHSHGGGGGGGGGGGEGGHGHSHGGKKGKKHRGHSHDPDSNHVHSHDSDGNHDEHSHDSDSNHNQWHDAEKADVSIINSRAIQWYPSNVTVAEEISAEDSDQQIAVTIDSGCDVENETTVEVRPQDEDTKSSTGKARANKSGSQMNMLGVFLHVLGDALGSVVVIVSALVIKFYPYDWAKRVDPAMSIIMSIIILSTTIPLFKNSALVLLQTVPTHIKVSELQEKLLSKVTGVTGLHEFHVWQLTGNRIVASGHIRVSNLSDYADVALKVKTFFHNEGIHSTTFQPESNEILGEQELSAEEMKRDCVLECGPDKKCFENTCCSNKLNKNANNSIGSAEPSQEINPSFEMADGSTNGAEPSQETNPIFEMVDETETTVDTDAPSTVTVANASNNIEMAEFSVNM